MKNILLVDASPRRGGNSDIGTGITSTGVWEIADLRRKRHPPVFDIYGNIAFDEIFSYQKFTQLPSHRMAEKIGMTFREEYPDSVNTRNSVYSIRK